MRTCQQAAPPAHSCRARAPRWRRAPATCTAASGASHVVARWSVDARFGCKSQAVALVRSTALL
jgi:hypothetical protein